MATISAAVVAIAGASARTQPAGAPFVDLTNRAALNQFLISHKISAKGVVIQRGSHNYAGPSCPGVRWTCTTAKRVIQLSMAPNAANVNQFDCTASTGGSQTGPNSCLIVQSSTSTDNNATCREKIGNPAGIQLCQIYQLNQSGRNSATVMQQVAADSGVTQAPEQSTQIGQWNGTGSNDASVNQDLKASQSASLGNTGTVTLMQDGHQTAVVGQHSDSGDNSARVNQSLQLKQNASGGTAITELQDTDNTRYNTSAAIYQNSDQAGSATPSSTGKNNADIHQFNDLNASGSKTGDLTQTQGNFNNGEFAHTDQWSQGISTSNTNQDEHQTEGSSQVSGTLSQTQIGPMRYDPNQGSNPGNSMGVTQNSDQHAGPGAYQNDREEASCQTSGLCTLSQTAKNDKQRGTNQCGPTSACDISTHVVAGSGEGDGVFTCDAGDLEEGGCTFPPFSPPANPLGSGGNFCEFFPYSPPCGYID